MIGYAKPATGTVTPLIRYVAGLDPDIKMPLRLEDRLNVFDEVALLGGRFWKFVIRHQSDREG